MDISKIMQDFNDQGYYIVRGMLDPTVLTGVRNELMQIVDQHAQKLLAEGKIAHDFADVPFEKRLYAIYENNMNEAPNLLRPELHREGIYALFFNAGLMDLIEQILGPELLLYPNYSGRPKLPEFEGTRVLWHQDGGYTEAVSNGKDISELRMVNVWAPVVPAAHENGCMQFIPGTHKLGVVPHLAKEHYLEIAEDYLLPKLDQAIDVEMEPGDVVFFNNLLFHQGLPNHSDHIRWSLDWRYLDATQPTLRPQKGHLARSSKNPDLVVQSKEAWAQLTLS